MKRSEQEFYVQVWVRSRFEREATILTEARMVPFVEQSSCSFCHNIEVLPGELQCDGEVPPILFPSPYLSQHLSIPYSKKPPPKQISGHSSHTKNIIITFNGVPLDTFNASFAQLSEKCKKFCSHSRLFILKEINTIFSLFHVYVCVLNNRVLELYCLTSYTA